MHTLSGLNAKWRFYKYDQQDKFKPHLDASKGQVGIIGKFEENKNERHGFRLNNDVSNGKE